MARPFDRPDLDQRKGGLTLYITGLLANAQPSLAYEGRLQFHNAIGQARAELWDGALPPGASVSVDNATQEIVVTWPAYQSAAAPIENPGFEQGETGWEFGAGWSVTTDNPPAGSKSAVFQNIRGESIVSSKTRYPVTPGQSVSASCAVRQGASSSGNAGAAVCLEYRNTAGDVVRSVEGNRVMSASNNAVKPSNVTESAQAGEATINIAGKGIRKRQNKDVWVDTFAWNLTQPSVGINVETTIGPITIRLTDSVGRTAFWTGTIRVALPALKWDELAKGAEIVIVNDGRDATNIDADGSTPLWFSVFGDTGHSGSGKWQYEVEVIATTGSAPMAGVATRENVPILTSDALFDSHTDAEAYTATIGHTGWIYRRLGSPQAIDGTASTGAWNTVGKVITIGIDLDAGTPTCKYYEDGVLGYTINLQPGKTWYPICSVYPGHNLRIRGGALAHPIPGYTNWV